jgi:hydrogenase maturation protein HypF
LKGVYVQRVRVTITGRVQGVGFRPTVVRLAKELALTGWVRNDTLGVTLEIQGGREAIDGLLERLQGDDRPPLAEITSCQEKIGSVVPDETDFVVASSQRKGKPHAEIAVDTAVCADCLQEMRDPQDRRHRYPFINCTNCGPRYTIIRAMPYDRPFTTMSEFAMCSHCRTQYQNTSDRRYHAQPVACPECGPQIWLSDARGRTMETDQETCLSMAADLLRRGRVVAIKGLGGFHLAVNPFDQDAVLRLRERKHRDHKPFALMASGIERIKPHARVSDAAVRQLLSPESPVVILPRRPDSTLARAVAMDLDTLGFMVCYTPLHHLLFAEGLDVLVMTSANISDEPLICDNRRAVDRLGDVADAFLMHNREIHRQVDDSIVHLVHDRPVPLRRSRGYMPNPIRLPGPVRHHILATGADLKNTFSLGRDSQLICSEHIGDLADAAVYQHYLRSIEHLKTLFEVTPTLVVHDLHPGYMSTAYAHQQTAVERFAVQHHWAHVAAVLAEYRLDESVIGLVADGTGYGPDGTIWGGECLIASLERFERVGGIRTFDLPGGDHASREAVRPLLGLLRDAFADSFSVENFKDILLPVEPDLIKLQVISQQIERRLNCVRTSSLGRLFDAMAALLGVGTENHFDAQLPMALEALVQEDRSLVAYGYLLEQTQTQQAQLDFRPMVREMVRGVRQGDDRGTMATRFHITLAEALCAWACRAWELYGLRKVALGGGVFCNRYLTERLMENLNARGFHVLLGRQWPPNDGGISVGQAAIAARVYG